MRVDGGASERLAWPVVSVGNLSVGGAGKTPFVIALARALTERGWVVDVLSRGYRASVGCGRAGRRGGRGGSCERVMEMSRG